MEPRRPHGGRPLEREAVQRTTARAARSGGLAGWRAELARRVRRARQEARAVAESDALAVYIVVGRQQRGEPVPAWLRRAAMAQQRAIRARMAGVEAVARAWEAAAREVLAGGRP